MRFSPIPAAGARCGRPARVDLGPLAMFAPTGAEPPRRFELFDHLATPPHSPNSALLPCLRHKPNCPFSNSTSTVAAGRQKTLDYVREFYVRNEPLPSA